MDEIFVTSCSRSRQNDSPKYSHWRNFHQNDIAASVRTPTKNIAIIITMFWAIPQTRLSYVNHKIDFTGICWKSEILSLWVFLWAYEIYSWDQKVTHIFGSDLWLSFLYAWNLWFKTFSLKLYFSFNIEGDVFVYINNGSKLWRQHAEHSYLWCLASRLKYSVVLSYCRWFETAWRWCDATVMEFL